MLYLETIMSEKLDEEKEKGLETFVTFQEEQL